MELWDTYDKYRNKTGRTVERGMHQMLIGEYHLVVHICIFNSKGELLIQQRQPFKEGWPDMWDITVGGSSVAGESSTEAAEREVYEEIGYKLSLDGVLPSLTINGDDWFDDIYIIRRDINIADLKLQYEEVKQVRWAEMEEILQMIESGSFLPYHKGFINLLFDMQDGRGVLSGKRLT
jgi:isopentenyldiphosphate isomerase